MRISIALASYNGSEYIQAQIESFINQTRLPDEVVISDDGSRDNTVLIVNELAKKAPFEIRLYQNSTNLGYSGNFNRAINECTGDLIFLSDQDDVWFKEKIAEIENLAIENPETLLFMNDAELVDGELKSTGLTKLGQIESAGLTDTSFVMGCCCAFKHELANICMPIPVGFPAHDEWIVKFAAGLNKKLVLRKVLQYYRRHTDNESQIIANRLSKVGKTDYLKDTLATNKNKHLELKSKKVAAFNEGIKIALSRSLPKYQVRLQEMLMDSNNEVSSYNERILIRKMGLFQRSIKAFKFYLIGGYKYSSGFKSLLRDIIGK